MTFLEWFQEHYDTETFPVRLNGRTLTLFKPVSLEPFIDPCDITHAFPLWAKLWEASGLLATHLATLPADPDKTMLEIGSGMGLVGIAAALAGHRVTLTEINADALNFARANAIYNNCPDLPIVRLDWNAPDLSGQFDYIVGSETLYRSSDIDGLKALLDRYLKPGGTIFLAEGVRQTGVEFWDRMRHHYHIQARRHVFRADDNAPLHVVLFRISRMADAWKESLAS